MSINSSDWHSDKENLKEQAMNCGYYIWYWLKTFIRIQPSQEWNLLHIMKYGFSFEFFAQYSLLTAWSSVLLVVCLFVCPPIEHLKYPAFCRISLLVVCLFVLPLIFWNIQRSAACLCLLFFCLSYHQSFEISNVLPHVSTCCLFASTNERPVDGLCKLALHLTDP